MPIRLRYQYKEYNGFEEANRISKARAEQKAYLLSMLSLGASFMVFCTIANLRSGMLYIYIAVLAIIGWSFYYLLAKYDLKTEKIVKKAIEEQIKEELEIRRQAELDNGRRHRRSERWKNK